MTESEKYEVEFTAVFYNVLPYPIDLYWVDLEGRKHEYDQPLKPGHNRSKTTFFTHPWIFKKSNNGSRLNAFVAGINGSVFEGSTFGVKGQNPRSNSYSQEQTTNYTVHVTINENGILSCN